MYSIYIYAYTPKCANAPISERIPELKPEPNELSSFWGCCCESPMQNGEDVNYLVWVWSVVSILEVHHNSGCHRWFLSGLTPGPGRLILKIFIDQKPISKLVNLNKSLEHLELVCWLWSYLRAVPAGQWLGKCGNWFLNNYGTSIIMYHHSSCPIPEFWEHCCWHFWLWLPGLRPTKSLESSSHGRKFGKKQNHPKNNLTELFSWQLPSPLFGSPMPCRTRPMWLPPPPMFQGPLPAVPELPSGMMPGHPMGFTLPAPFQQSIKWFKHIQMVVISLRHYPLVN